MTKALFPAPGQLVLTCRVSSTKKKKRIVTIERGTKSMRFVSRQYKNKKIIRNAKYNAIYKHMNKGGSSDALVTIIDFEFNYYDNFVTRKTVTRLDKRTNKRRKWNEVRNINNNKLIGRILKKSATGGTIR